MHRGWMSIPLMLVLAAGVAGVACGGVDESGNEVAEPAGSQVDPEPDVLILGNTTCPVMEASVMAGQFVDWNGIRIAICCPGCDRTITEDPMPYIEKLSRDHSISEENREMLLLLLEDGDATDSSTSDSSRPGGSCCG